MKPAPALPCPRPTPWWVGALSNDYVGSVSTSAGSGARCVYVRYGNDDSLAALVPEAADYRVKNGNIVVGSPFWDIPGATPAEDAGAVTLMPATGMAGTVTSANSLVGGAPGDTVGGKPADAFPGDLEMRFSVLANGNYVVASPLWDLNAGLIDVGAVTWVDGATGLTGAVSTANSLHGSSFADQVGLNSEAVLVNGNYLVVSPLWDYTGVAIESGAVTWVNGADGTLSGGAGPGAAVSVTNSLVSSNANDKLGKAESCASAEQWQLYRRQCQLGI